MSASAPRPGTLSVKMISVEGMRRISAFFFGRGSRIIESAELVLIDLEIFLCVPRSHQRAVFNLELCACHPEPRRRRGTSPAVNDHANCFVLSITGVRPSLALGMTGLRETKAHGLRSSRASSDPRR